MTDALPETFLIAHDDYHAEFVGRTGDDRQFFLTTPFIAASNQRAGCEYLALFLFDDEGKFVEAAIDDLGNFEDLNLRFLAAKRRQQLAVGVSPRLTTGVSPAAKRR